MSTNIFNTVVVLLNCSLLVLPVLLAERRGGGSQKLRMVCFFGWAYLGVFLSTVSHARRGLY
jgi:hypothetical protein